MARRARLISAGRDALVVIHKLAQYFYCLSSRILKDWRLIGDCWGRYVMLPFNRSLFDDIYLPQDPGYLCIQIGRENPGRVRVVDRRSQCCFILCCFRLPRNDLRNNDLGR